MREHLVIGSIRYWCAMQNPQRMAVGLRALRRVTALVIIMVFGIVGIRAEDTQPEAKAVRAGDAKPESTEKSSNAKRLLAFHLGDAEQYEIYRNRDRSEKLELEPKPVYLWTNPLRSGQNGAVFVWTYQGRPEVIASIFSVPRNGKRQVYHELHSLSSEILVPVRASPKQWQPRAGFHLKPLPEAPPPAEAAKQRGFQLRTLSRDFTAHSVDYDQKTWQLRLLPQPLF